MSQLGKRLISSAGILAVALTTIFLAPQWVFFIFIEAFLLLGLFEFLELAKRKGIVVFRNTIMLFGALIPFAILYGRTGEVLMLATIVVFLLHFKPELRRQALTGTAISIFSLVYVMWSCSHMILLRALPSGGWWVFYIILLVKTGDAGAYFIGKNYGKTKLAIHISPKKTVEGAVGGFVTTVILSMLSFIYLPDIAIGHLLIMGVFVALLAQLGDLAESLIKRDVDIKDSGVVPGLGGILDVLDSLILTIPFVYFYVTGILGLSA